ncbi:MAG: helix-turn-helix transcriptional regulator [Pirellulales bacterium]
MSPRNRAKEPDPKLPSGQWAIHLCALMEAKGTTATELAEAVGKGRATVFQWLRGDLIPSLDHWPTIAKALGLKSWQQLVPPSTKQK